MLYHIIPFLTLKPPSHPIGQTPTPSYRSHPLTQSSISASIPNLQTFDMLANPHPFRVKDPPALPRLLNIPPILGGSCLEKKKTFTTSTVNVLILQNGGFYFVVRKVDIDKLD